MPPPTTTHKRRRGGEKQLQRHLNLLAQSSEATPPTAREGRKNAEEIRESSADREQGTSSDSNNRSRSQGIRSSSSDVVEVGSNPIAKLPRGQDDAGDRSRSSKKRRKRSSGRGQDQYGYLQSSGMPHGTPASKPGYRSQGTPRPISIPSSSATASNKRQNRRSNSSASQERQGSSSGRKPRHRSLNRSKSAQSQDDMYESEKPVQVTASYNSENDPAIFLLFSSQETAASHTSRLQAKDTSSPPPPSAHRTNGRGKTHALPRDRVRQSRRQPPEPRHDSDGSPDELALHGSEDRAMPGSSAPSIQPSSTPVPAPPTSAAIAANGIKSSATHQMIVEIPSPSKRKNPSSSMHGRQAPRGLPGGPPLSLNSLPTYKTPTYKPASQQRTPKSSSQIAAEALTGVPVAFDHLLHDEIASMPARAPEDHCAKAGQASSPSQIKGRLSDLQLPPPSQRRAPYQSAVYTSGRAAESDDEDSIPVAPSSSTPKPLPNMLRDAKPYGIINIHSSSPGSAVGTSLKGVQSGRTRPAVAASAIDQPEKGVVANKKRQNRLQDDYGGSQAPPVLRSGRKRGSSEAESLPVAKKRKTDISTAAKVLKAPKGKRTSRDDSSSSDEEVATVRAVTSSARARPRATPTARAKRVGRKATTTKTQARPDDPDPNTSTDSGPTVVSSPRKKVAGSARDEEDKENIDDPNTTHFGGEATQAMWLRNARNNLDIDVRPSSDDEIAVAEHAEESDGEDLSVELLLGLNGKADAEKGVLCPFCDAPLPLKPSRLLVQGLIRLCNRVDLEPRYTSSNPYAVQLPITFTAATCKRHREEAEIIPAGIAAGYPAAGDIDWASLPERLDERCAGALLCIVDGKYHSYFFDLAKAEWKARGRRRMGNVMSEWASFDREIPGYYGPRGFEVIMRWLQEKLVDRGWLTVKHTNPLDIDTYLRRVMVPEAAVRLIQDDRPSIHPPQAEEILERSRAYGIAVFGTDEMTGRHGGHPVPADVEGTSATRGEGGGGASAKNDTKAVGVPATRPSARLVDFDDAEEEDGETKEERRARKKEEREQKLEKEELLSSQGPAADGLMRGELAIATLKSLL